MKVSALIFKKIAKLLAIRHIYLAKSLSLKDKRLELPPNLDYIRDSSLCLCAEEIMARNVGGNVAELGVYRGNFAKRINSLFPNKKIYLFDTFAGFTENAKKIENELMGVEIHQDFSQTSVDLVKQKMRYPENCIFEIGEFPESAKDCNDTFCFVSIDADLFEPIYEGLKFFYPKLQKNGYIFVHDFNNECYLGSREAVVRFCEETGICHVPIADNGGTAIITK